MSNLEESNALTEESSELFEHYRFQVDKGQTALRIDKYLMNHIEGATRTKIQAAAKSGNILVNDRAVKQNYKVRPNDTISIVLPYPPRETEIFPQNIPLDVVYEDADIIIINKQPGMVVHPGHNNFEGTLLHALFYHFHGDDVSTSKNPASPYLAHRIDKDTSGLLLVAKNEAAQVHLAKQFFEHSVERKYNALVWGDLEEDGTIIGNLGRSPQDRRVMTVFEDESSGRHAVTHYKVLKRYGYVSLVECQLETGRTHQIRAHMKYIKHPLFGDKTYGGDKILKGTTFSKYKQFIDNCFKILPRQALHAKSLGFVHPTTGEKMSFDSELPQDMQQVLDKWEVYSKYSMD